MLLLTRSEFPSAPQPSTHEREDSSEKKQYIQNTPLVPWGAEVGWVYWVKMIEISLTFPVPEIIGFTEDKLDQRDSSNAIAHNLQVKGELKF